MDNFLDSDRPVDDKIGIIVAALAGAQQDYKFGSRESAVSTVRACSVCLAELARQLNGLDVAEGQGRR